MLPFPQYELQARWISRVLSGRVQLPSAAEMEVPHLPLSCACSCLVHSLGPQALLGFWAWLQLEYHTLLSIAIINERHVTRQMYHLTHLGDCCARSTPRRSTSSWKQTASHNASRTAWTATTSGATTRSHFWQDCSFVDAAVPTGSTACFHARLGN